MAACEMLGLDPLFIANEGKMVAIVPEQGSEKALDAMRKSEYGREAAVIGRVVEDHAGMDWPGPPLAERGSSICRPESSCRASAEAARQRTTMPWGSREQSETAPP